jgi:hypothetical protein
VKSLQFSIPTNVAGALNAIRSGTTLDAFEAAKWLYKDGRHDRSIRLAGKLMEIASDKRCAVWNRIAAVHAVGSLEPRTWIAPGLIALLADEQEDFKIRGHAAEALGYYREKSAIPLLRKILCSRQRPYLKVDCIFALSKMWEFSDDLKTFNPNARKALNKFARTQPTGKAGRELKRAMLGIRLGWI